MVSPSELKYALVQELTSRPRVTSSSGTLTATREKCSFFSLPISLYSLKIYFLQCWIQREVYVSHSLAEKFDTKGLMPIPVPHRSFRR